MWWNLATLRHEVFAADLGNVVTCVERVGEGISGGRFQRQGAVFVDGEVVFADLLPVVAVRRRPLLPSLHVDDHVEVVLMR